MRRRSGRRRSPAGRWVGRRATTVSSMAFGKAEAGVPACPVAVLQEETDEEADDAFWDEVGRVAALSLLLTAPKRKAPGAGPTAWGSHCPMSAACLRLTPFAVLEPGCEVADPSLPTC